MPKKRITSLDVAKAAGVSRTTVSFVMNNVTSANISESTRLRVLEVAKTLNYHPNASGKKLASGKSLTIGLILQQSPTHVYADAFLLQVMVSIEQAVAPFGFHVLLKPINPDKPLAFHQLITENHVDGIILSGPRQDDTEVIQHFDEGFPIILMGQIEGSHIPFVDINAVEGAFTATQHLIDLGHTAIGIITNASLGYTSAQQRWQGYKNALERNGITPNPLFLQEGDYTPASGYEAMQRMLKNVPELTAVFVASDVVAVGAIQAIHQAGKRIPEDIAIIGFDDIPIAAHLTPPLSTIRLPALALGKIAGESIVHLILGETLDLQETLLDTSLVIRESTKGKSA